MKFTLIFILVFSAISVYGETIKGEVKRIYPTRNTVYFHLKNDTCISGQQYYYFSMNDKDNIGKYAAKNWYTMLLASAMASKPVHVRVDSCPGEGHVQI